MMNNGDVITGTDLNNNWDLNIFYIKGHKTNTNSIILSAVLLCINKFSINT